MSSPVLKIGSIFGANKPSKPQSQPNQADKSIFGSQSSKFEASSRKISPQNQRSQGMSNIASLSDRRANNTQDRAQQNWRNQEPNRGMHKGVRRGGSTQNPRKSHSPTDMQIGDQTFQTWNQDPKIIPFPNARGNRLMSSAMASLAQQQKGPDNFKGFFSNKRDGSKSDSSQPTPERRPKERGQKDLKQNPKFNQRDLNQDFKPRQREFNKDFKPRQKRPCKFFLEGNCIKGDKCEFEHTLSPNPKKQFKIADSEKPGNRSWYNSKEKQTRKPLVVRKPQLESPEVQSDQDIEVENPYDEQEEEEQEDDQDQDEDYNSEEEHKDQIESLGSDPSFGDKNRGKNLNALLSQIKNKDAKSGKPKAKSEQGSDVDVQSNTDTFGAIRKPKSSDIKMRKPFAISEDNSKKVIKEIPQMEDNSSLLSDESINESEEFKGINQMIFVLPTKLHKVSDEGSFEKLKEIINKCSSNIKIRTEIENSKGKLLKMCDPEEALKREMSRDLSIFEMDPENTDLSVIDRDRPPRAMLDWAVKIYKRSAADIKLDDPLTIRPIPIIKLVLDYLLDEIADIDKVEKSKFVKPIESGKITFNEIFTFIFDRTRAIRQEFTILGENTKKDIIQILEKIARFHCLAANEALDLSSFNMKQNSEQFTSTLTSIRESYDLVNEILEDEENELKEIETDNMYRSPNEPEFRAYMILTQINNNLEVLETLQSLRHEVLVSKEVKLAVKIFKAYQNKDTDTYFNCLKKCPYLFACCLTYSICEMRKRALKTFSSTMFVIGIDPITNQKSNYFKLELKFLTELLCFNNEEEASSFISTLGYKAIKNPVTQNFEVVKFGEPSEVWKPKTNIRFIESKRIIKSSICSRADIIRGVACTLKSQLKKHKAPSSSPIKLKEVINPPSRAVSNPVVKSVHDEAKKLEEKLEADKAREILEKELKEKMLARKQALQEQQEKDNALKELKEKQEAEKKRLEMEKARIEAERKRKIEELERKRREAEEKRRRELERRREEVTKKNQKKRTQEIFRIYFDKFKKFHQKKQEIKKFVKSFYTIENSEPRKSFGGISKIFDRKCRIYPLNEIKDQFSNAIVNILNERIDKNINLSEPESIHFRITCLLTRPEGDSRISSVFTNWLIKSLSNNKKSLSTVIRKFLDICTQTTSQSAIIFCKNTEISQNLNLCYTLNTHYEYHPEEESRKDSHFYKELVNGTNLIIYVVNNRTSYNCLKLMCKSILEYSSKTLLVFNIEKISGVKKFEIIDFLDSQICNNKFRATFCEEINLPDDEERLSLQISEKSYWSRKTIFSVLKAIKETNIIESNYSLKSEVCFCKNLSNTLSYHPFIEYIGKILFDSSYSFVDSATNQYNAEQVLTNQEQKLWEIMEDKIKSHEISTLDFKIAVLNKILAIIVENLKAGIANCCMMDPRYFGSNAKMIIVCKNDISNMIQLLNFSPSPFKLKYFGVAPENYWDSDFLNSRLQSYLTSYLISVTQSFNPDLPISSIKSLTQSVRCDVAKHWSSLPPSDFEIDCRLIFITILKIIEKSLHSLYIKCIYRNFTDNTCEMLKRLNIEQLFEDIKTSAQFKITEKYNRMQDVSHWELSNNKIRMVEYTKTHLKKREKKEMRKNKQVIEVKNEEKNKRPKLQEITEIDLDDVKSYSSTEEEGEDQEMTKDVIQQIERYIREIDDALLVD